MTAKMRGSDDAPGHDFAGLDAPKAKWMRRLRDLALGRCEGWIVIAGTVQ